MNNCTPESGTNTETEPFACGTNGSVACPRNWIAATVQMNCERKIAANLNRLGYETYVPVQKEKHRWSDRVKTVDRILIPMIVFIKVSRNEYRIIEKIHGIHRLVRYPGSKEPASIIPDDQIDRLRFMLEKSDSEVTLVSNLKVGDPVQIISGPLKGLNGVLSTTDEKHSIVAVRIELLGYACVKIPVNCLSA